MDVHQLSAEKAELQDRAQRIVGPQAAGILQSIAAIAVDAADGVDERLAWLQKHLAMVELANQLTLIECRLNTPVN